MARLTTSGANTAYALDSIIKGTGKSLSYPSSINADYAGNIWVTSSNFNDTSGTTSVFQIAAASPASAVPVSGLTFASSTYIGEASRSANTGVGRFLELYADASHSTCRSVVMPPCAVMRIHSQHASAHQPGCLHPIGRRTLGRSRFTRECKPCAADGCCACCRRQRRPHGRQHRAAPGDGLLVLDPRHRHPRYARVQARCVRLPIAQLSACSARVPHRKGSDRMCLTSAKPSQPLITRPHSSINSS